MADKLTISLTGPAETFVRQQAKTNGISNAAYVSMLIARERNSRQAEASQSKKKQGPASFRPQDALFESNMLYGAEPQSNGFTPKFKPL